MERDSTHTVSARPHLAEPLALQTTRADFASLMELTPHAVRPYPLGPLALLCHMRARTHVMLTPHAVRP